MGKQVEVNKAVLDKFDMAFVPSTQFVYFPKAGKQYNLRVITVKQVEDLIKRGDKTFTKKSKTSS